MNDNFAGRYYSDCEKGRFINQKKVNEALDTLGYGDLIQRKDANPLTVRLICAKKSIERLNEIIIQHNPIASTFHSVIINSSEIVKSVNPHNFGTTTMPLTSGSGIDCRIPNYSYNNEIPSGEISEILQFHDNKLLPIDISRNNFPPFLVHEQIYNFFTNYGSVLDRFSHEIVSLYPLNLSTSDNLNWSFLNSKKSGLLDDLYAQNSNLSIEINMFYINTTSGILNYRNHLVHDGIIRISVNSDPPNQCWNVKITSNPDDEKSPIDKPALDFCLSAFNELLDFLDNCYAIINTEISKSGFPFTK